MTPSYLKVHLPPLRSRLLRNCNSDKYHDIFCVTSRYMSSFFPEVIKSWNNLDINFRTCTTLTSFKQMIFNLIKPDPKSVFGINGIHGLKYIFQLRVQLSALKCHKKHHNFIDTPVDWCDCHCAPEDTAHYLFHCSFYRNPRLKLYDTVLNILNEKMIGHLSMDVNLYLYGHRVLTCAENTQILLATITYINETGRFA